MRTIDRLLQTVMTMDGLAPMERQVILNRLEVPPSDAEIAAAVGQLEATDWRAYPRTWPAAAKTGEQDSASGA